MAASRLSDDSKEHIDLLSKIMERKSLLAEEDEELPSSGEKIGTFHTRSEPLVIRRQVHTPATIDEIYADQSEPQTTCQVVKNTCQVSPKCVGRHVLNFFPFVRFLRNYQWRSWIVADLISGLSVGFIHVPQGLAFGILASLGPVIGLYTSFFPVLVYLLFGTSPHVSMGTNALIALLTANLVNREADHFRSALGVNETWTAEEELQYKVGIAAASCFLGGVILLGMGLLRLGFITNFLSKSFIGGFTFSAAVHITTSQVVKMLHVKTKGHDGLGKLVLTYIDIFKNITDTNPADIIVGLICMTVLLAVKIGINERFQHKMKIPVPIELIIVIVSTAISHFAQLHDHFGIGVVGDVPTGLPPPSLPNMGSLSRVATDAFVTSILIFALTISLAKLTAKMNDITIDDNQEMVAYGMCLLVGGFFQNFPACIAPPRIMMLNSLGSKSTFNGVPTAVFILLVLLVVGQLFVSLPIAMLAAMIIVAMKDLLLQIRNLKSLWNVNKSDFFIWVVTAAFSIFGDLDIGLLVGVVFSMATVMCVGQLARGTLLGKATHEDLLLNMDRKGICPIPGVKIFRFESPLYFASQERFKNQLYSLVMNPTAKPNNKDAKDTVAVPIPPDPPTTKDPLTLGEDCTPIPHSSLIDTPTNSLAVESKKNGDLAHMTSHVILDCSAMIYIDVAGVDMLTLVMMQFSRAGVEVWLADVPVGTLGTLQRAGFVEGIGKDRIFYSVMDALQKLPQREVGSVRL